MCFYQFVAIIHNYTCGGIHIYIIIERGRMLHSFREQGEGLGMRLCHQAKYRNNHLQTHNSSIRLKTKQTRHASTYV